MSQPTVRNRSVKVGWTCGVKPQCQHRSEFMAWLHCIAVDMWAAYKTEILTAAAVGMALAAAFIYVWQHIHVPILWR